MHILLIEATQLATFTNKFVWLLADQPVTDEGGMFFSQVAARHDAKSFKGI